MPAALEVRSLARRFGVRWALRGVSLRVSQGEVVALLGANGSGKTTLLRVAATSLRPTRGEGWVYGHSLVREPDRVREHVGFFGYLPGLYDDLTALENLAFSMRMITGGRADRRELLRVLERVGLAREAGERARSFSAGMRRRLALARLMLRPPRLLLLDEPYASFDADGVELVNEFVVECRREGAGVLLATHDLDRVSAVADRTAVLAAGRLVESDGLAVDWAASARGAVS